MSKATTVKQYLDALPEDRRKALEAVRRVIKSNLDSKYEEGIQYGMIGYYVPHSVFADGYHCDPKQPLPFASIASQKNHMAVYLFCLYNDPAEIARFEAEWKKTGKKLDMGKACVRFKKIEDIPLDVVGKTFERVTLKKFLKHYEEAIETSNKRASTKRAAKKTTKKAPAKKASAKSKVVKKPATKKKAAKKSTSRSS